MAVKRKPVPWIYTENAVFKNWVWNTPNFTVKVIGEGDPLQGGAVFTWSINEKTERGSFVFESSTSRTFREAELEIVEIIAKSWDKKLGYSEYAGELATTFSIHGGKRIDFEPFVGEKVELTFINGDKTDSRIGQFAIRNYKALLQLENNKVIEIPPAIIKEITLK